jgi:hypothetical protein
MYQYNNKNTKNGTTYQGWDNTRSGSGQTLEKLPPIVTSVNGKTRYYSAVDAEIYFGDVFIDEVTNIAWSIQQQSLPIYGYNSYTFDDMAVGSRIVQGQFAINFTERNFLSKLQSNTNFQKMSRRMYGEDNPATCDFYSDFRKRLHLPVWDKGFDIVVGFGETKADALSGAKGMYGTYLVLDTVQITGSSIQLDYNGDPVQEMYSFIARDVKEAFSDAAEANPSSVTSENLITTATNTSYITITGTIDPASNLITMTSDEKVIFTEGTLQLSGTYTNKLISTLMKLTVIDSTRLIYSVSPDFVTAFNKECSTKSTMLGIVICKYNSKATTGATKGQVVQQQYTIEFKIKK